MVLVLWLQQWWCVCTAGSMWRVMVLLTHCELGANQSINRSIVIWWAPKDRKSTRNTWINYCVPHRLMYGCPQHTHAHAHFYLWKPTFWSCTSILCCAQLSNHQIPLPWEQDKWEACLFSLHSFCLILFFLFFIHLLLLFLHSVA